MHLGNHTGPFTSLYRGEIEIPGGKNTIPVMAELIEYLLYASHYPLCALFHLNLSRTLQRRHFHSHFTDEEIGAQGACITCLGSHNWLGTAMS